MSDFNYILIKHLSELHLKTQFVPRSKHTPSPYKTISLMLKLENYRSLF
jgi:hypothetical protein